MNEKQSMHDRNLITVEVNYQFIKSQIILQCYYCFRILVAAHKTPHNNSLTLMVSNNNTSRINEFYKATPIFIL